MKQSAGEFYNNLKGKRVAFIGAGVSHRECIEVFVKKGAVVTLCDKKPDVNAFGAYGETLKQLGVRLSLGEHYLDGLAGQDIIMRTPGFEYFTPELQAAKAAGSEVTSEMELFFELCPCEKVAVTGSDGKTTTTTLIAEMLKAAGRTVHLGGNLGRALLPVVEQIAPTDVAVVELSSFQLISMRESPDVAVVTNVTPNHLDHHKDMQEYIDAKRNIFAHQGAFSRTVLGVDNDVAASFANPECVRGQLFEFSVKRPVRTGAFLGEDGIIYMSVNGERTKIMHAAEIKLPGLHNIENYLAAICATWGYVDREAIYNVAVEFDGVEHRIEFVREKDGVRWYNDSIATTPTRTIAGLESFDQKLVIIAGGYDKKIPFDPLIPKLVERVKTLILIGATADTIEAEVRAYPGFDPAELAILRAGSLEEAVKKAAEAAGPGDIVSLSPACASFDMFPNYGTRGRRFKELVNAL